MNQFWSRLGRLVGGLFLYGGGTVSIGLLAVIVASHAAGGWLAFLAFALVFFGLVPAVLGGWVLAMSARLKQQAIRERFFQLLRLKKGRLSVMEFAIATRLEPATARQQMDEWAREFTATFEVNDHGDIYYIFAIDPLMLPESSTAEMLSQTIRQWLQSSL